MYHFLSGYTAKVAGTELGVKEPTATFSPCFGEAFLMVHPMKYAEILAKKMDEHKASAYLINTGWIAGAYGIGHRIPLKDNRLIVDDILDDSLDKAEFETLPFFNLQVPKAVNGVDSKILNPRNLWADKSAYDQAARKLASLFIGNFKLYTDAPQAKALISAGPCIEDLQHLASSK